MEIERIEITNFVGLRHLVVDVDAPVLLACGPNGAGKSSLIEGVRFALTGETPRAALKKDLPALLSAGQKGGAVKVAYDGREVTRDVKGGAAFGAPDELGALAYTLDAPRLASMDPKERRAALFGLMGVAFSPAAVAKELIGRGHAEQHVERIKPLLRAGFDAAAGEARKLAAEARGGWKEVTGETYGAVKAATWQAPRAPDVPEVDDGKDVATLRETYEQAVAHASALSARKAAAEQAVISAQRLRDRAAKVATLREDLAKLESRQAAQAPAQTPIGDCPQCGAALAKAGAALVVAAPRDPADVPDATLAGAIDALRRELRDAEQAKVALDEIAEQKPAAIPTDDDVRHAHDLIDAARRDLEVAEGQHRAVAEQRRVAAENAQRTERAQGLHALVTAWSEIEAALSPNGLPAELLARALRPLNEALERVRDASGWPLVQVADDIAITAGGRPYGLLSESEQWRADAALAYAAALVSGCGLVLLDRFDVLDLPSRGQFVRLTLAMAGGDVQTIAAGTLKAPPPERDGLQVLWMGEAVKEEAA